MSGDTCREMGAGYNIRTSHHSPYAGDQVHGFGFHACGVIAGTEARIRLRATPANCRARTDDQLGLPLLTWEVHNTNGGRSHGGWSRRI